MPEPKTPVLQIIFTARMVAEKGVKVLIEAAENSKTVTMGKLDSFYVVDFPLIL